MNPFKFKMKGGKKSNVSTVDITDIARHGNMGPAVQIRKLV